MSFENLAKQSPMGPAAEAYAAEIVARSRAVAAAGNLVTDVPYGADEWQRLDIYLPAQAKANGVPVLLFLHGGSWTHGHKEWMGFMAPCFTDLPAIFVSVGYRLVPQVRFPAPLDDTIDALAWVHAHIARHGGDPGRIFVGGHSAGGHLAALASLHRDKLAAARLPPDAVKGCFPVSATYSFAPGELEARGNHLLQVPEQAAEASPINFVAGSRVPFLIAWGDADFEQVLRTGPEMVAALERSGARTEQLVLPGHDHFAASLAGGEAGSPWVEHVRSWMLHHGGTR